MHIAIDYTSAIRQRAGIGTYTRSLVAALLAQDSNNRYTLLTSGRPDYPLLFPRAENVRIHSLPISERSLNVLWQRWHMFIPATLFTGPADIYHGPDFVLPPLAKKTRKIVTIHDLAFLTHPEYSTPALADYLRQAVPRAIATADVVATISHEVSRTLIEHLHTPREKLVVVPNGVSAAFRRISDPIILDATRYKFNLKQPFVLAVGTLEPRKNHASLIKAFHQVHKKKNGPVQLVIAGGTGWRYEETRQLVAELKLEKKVRFLGRVSELELITLYSLAAVFAFPSFFAGFGIPVLEAMACGAPVITANTSSLPEVAGDAALLVDPHNSDQLAAAITRLLTDEQLREELRQKGYQRAQHYNWEVSARKMLTIYQKLSDGHTDFKDEGALQ